METRSLISKSAIEADNADRNKAFQQDNADQKEMRKTPATSADLVTDFEIC